MSDTEALISEEDDNDSSGLTPSEIRIVLVGKTGSGKSSAGNTILGLELFDTAVSPESITKNCESGQVQIDDRIISVTDTPGLFDTQMEKEQMKDEIIRCIEMSSPGPHAFLLVIRLDVRFTDEEKNTVKWIQDNFGVEAARYTIVLFTHFDALEGIPIEEYISKNHYLQSLVNECGHRFHSFNNKDKKKRSQVPELLEKIKNLVEENGGEHYTNEIYKEAQRTSNIHQFWLENPRIVLLGKTGSGKTKTRKNIVGRQGNSPDSATKTCEKQEASVAGKSMRIIDTPGLIGASEEKTKDEIEKLVYMSDPGPCVFLLVIKVGRFTDEEKNTVKWIQENFGEEALRYTIILFAHADHLKEKPLDQYIRETPGLQELTEGFGGRFYSFNNESIEHRDQVTELLEKIEEMMENNKWRHYTSQMLQKAQRRKLFWSGKPRVVLLGKTRSGKSTTGNTIVGRESFKRRNSADFVTKSCKTHKACVDGKGMKVIDTPGLTDASEKTKAEIVKFIKKSAPGLHVFLLVIRLDVRLTEEEKNIVRWIQENFGVEAARYTIVLFTHADTLEGKPLEGYIRESNDVQALVNNCGGFHSFNNKDMENRSQVPELLEKIEDMMEKNEGGHDTDDIYQDTQGMILDRSQFWLLNPRIVLLGKTGSGKTSAVETIVGRESFTKTCELKEACVAGKNMTIIDTPGLTDASEKKIKNEIKKLVMKSDPGPYVFLLVIRLDEIFTDKEKNRVKWIEDNFGEDAAHHTIILFTHTDHLGSISIDEYISERKFLQSLIDSCGGRFSIQETNNPNQVTKLLKIVEKMAEGNELEDYTNEKSQGNVPRTIRRLRDIAIGTGSTGTAAIIAGSIALGLTEVVFAPAAVVTIGAVAVVGAFVFGGIAIYKRFALKD